MRISDWSSDVCSSDLLLAGPALAIVSGEVALDRSWYTASRASAGIVPPAAATPEAVVQVYGARAFDWRGAFAVHNWSAVKPQGGPDYVTYAGIGRASCRERAVQYMDVSVGARSLKKKHNNT